MSLKSKVKSKYNSIIIIRYILYIPVTIYIAAAIYIKRNLKERFYSYKYYHSSKLYKLNDLTIGIKTLGENNTRFPHPLGIVIGIGVNIGRSCTIYQNVTIGAKNQKDADDCKYPSIGNDVIIGCNAVIIGNITIGDGVCVGASSLVNCDVPNNAIVVGNPCKIILK